MTGRPTLDNSVMNVVADPAVSSSLNAVDGAVIIILIISGLLAYARGFVHETLAVGGWVGAFFATLYGYSYVQPIAREYIPAELLADIAAGAAIFIITLTALSFVSRAISSRVKESALNVLDRSLGFLFGVARGVVIICVLFIGFEFLIPRDDHPEWATSARTMPFIIQGADMMYDLFPKEAEVEMPDVDQQDVQDVIDLIRPEAKPEHETPPEDNGYSDRERQGIENLLENSQ